MNKVILSGNLGKDPDEKSFGTSSVVNFSLATRNTFKNKEGNYDSTWHNCTVWNEKLREIAMKYLKKGSKVLVTGEIRVENYEKDGVKHSATKINVLEIEFLSSQNNDSADSEPASKTTASPSPAPTETTGDVPF